MTKFPSCLLLVAVVFLTGCSSSTSHLPRPRPPADDDEAVASNKPAPQVIQAPASVAGSPVAPNPTPPGAVPASNSPTPGNQAATTPATNSTISELDRRARTINQLRRISQALENYREKNDNYPMARTENGNVSWRVLLLPWLGFRDLYQKFKLDEPWNSENNRLLLGKIPDVYQSLERNDEKTNFLLLTGAGTLYEGIEPLAVEQCVDGIENTLLLVEASDALARPWTQPDDYVFQRATAQADLFTLNRDCCFAVFGGAASARRLPANIADATLLGLISPRGGEKVRYQDATTYAHPEIDLALRTELEKSPIARFDASSAKPNDGAPAAGGAAPSVPISVANSTGSPVGGPGISSKSVSVNTNTDSPPPARSGNDVASEGRTDVPSEAQLEAASTIVRELYGKEFNMATTRDKKREFAKKMLDEAAKVGDDSVGKYVLLRAARDVASKSGDLVTTLTAVDRMAVDFRMDALSAKLKILEQGAANLENSAELDQLYDNGLDLGDQALRLDRFEEARQLFHLAMNAARRGKQSDRAKIISEREANLVDAKRTYSKVSDRVHQFLRAPDDPTANAAVGRYFCLIKQEWDRGLPMLARGDDQSLRAIAALELQHPTKADEQAGLADQWWNWSEKALVDLERSNARQRACSWYEKALPQLQPSLQKVHIEKRVADASESSRQNR